MLLELIVVVVRKKQCVAIGFGLGRCRGACLTRSARHELDDHCIAQVLRDHAGEHTGIAIMRPTGPKGQN